MPATKSESRPGVRIGWAVLGRSSPTGSREVRSLEERCCGPCKVRDLRAVETQKIKSMDVGASGNVQAGVGASEPGFRGI